MYQISKKNNFYSIFISLIFFSANIVCGVHAKATEQTKSSTSPLLTLEGLEKANKNIKPLLEKITYYIHSILWTQKVRVGRQMKSLKDYRLSDFKSKLHLIGTIKFHDQALIKKNKGLQGIQQMVKKDLEKMGIKTKQSDLVRFINTEVLPYCASKTLLKYQDLEEPSHPQGVQKKAKKSLTIAQLENEKGQEAVHDMLNPMCNFVMTTLWREKVRIKGQLKNLNSYYPALEKKDLIEKILLHDSLFSKANPNVENLEKIVQKALDKNKIKGVNYDVSGFIKDQALSYCLVNIVEIYDE